MKFETLNGLFQNEVRDLYDAEKRLVRAIPKMVKKATSEDLREALAEHLDVTRGHVDRLEQIFKKLGVAAKAKACAGMKGIIEEGGEVLAAGGDDALVDAAIIGAAQRVEHYEMAAYASARMLAEHLDHVEMVDLLQQTWDEENEADEKLAEIAGQLLANIQSGQPAVRAAGQSRREN